MRSTQLCSGAVSHPLEVPFVDGLVSGFVNVEIGSPSSQYKLILDPGSSNTWVGAGKAYVATSSSQQTNDTVSVAYGSGNFTGNEYADTVTLSGVSFDQSIGVATTAVGFQDVDGIMGVGPTNLTTGTLSPDSEEEIPTVTDNLFSQQYIDSRVVTITDQKLVFGSTPLENVLYVTITQSSPANTFWGLDASVAYSAKSLLPVTAGIIDHGTTLTSLATSGYNNFMRETGAKQDEKTGLPVLASCDGLLPIILTLGGINITIPVENYRWPADNNTDIGGDPNKCYLALSDVGTNFDTFRKGPSLQFLQSSLPNTNGSGIDFILGYNTLKHFGVVLDTDNSMIGIAS